MADRPIDWPAALIVGIGFVALVWFGLLAPLGR